MKEEWLFPGAMVPVDMETTAALVAEIKRLIDVVGGLVPAQEAIYGMNQDDWKNVVAAIAKVRDGRGMYLACRPADVFQDWFLALGIAKVKDRGNT